LHNGLNREYIYYAPANLQVDAPIVFVAHGFTASAQGIMNYCGMNTIASFVLSDFTDITHLNKEAANFFTSKLDSIIVNKR